MILRNLYKFIVSIGIVVVVGLLIGILIGGSGPASNDNILQLARPAFIDTASAEELAVIDTIVNEAGIAAYFKSSSSVTLADVADAFRTIEAQTSNYILGSVPVPNYPERHDIHVYIHKDGWFLAYYLAADPASKIFDWREYNNSGHTDLTTKFENALEVLAAEAAVLFTSATYYDFRNPNANSLILVAELSSSGTDSFEVNLPGSFTYFERSWALGTSVWSASYKLNEEVIRNWSYLSGWNYDWGTFTSSQMLPDQYHLLEIGTYGANSYGGLALIYQVP